MSSTSAGELHEALIAAFGNGPFQGKLIPGTEWIPKRTIRESSDCMHRAFIAQSIGQIKIAGVSYTASPVPIDLSPITHDFTVRRI